MEKTVADYPRLVAQFHSKNGDLQPEQISGGSHKEIWWKCSVAEDHEWPAIAKSRMRGGNGCPCCAGKNVPSNCLSTMHPELVREWHPKNSLTPDDVVTGSHKKIWWKCHEGAWPDGTFADDHEWEASVKDRTQGNGCPCCAGKKVVPSNCLSTTHPELAKGWYSARNSLTSNDVFGGSTKKIWWKCYEGTWSDGTFADDHEWETSPNNRTNNNTGCPCCAGKKVVPSNCLSTTHPELVKEWHPKNDLTPGDVVAGSQKKVWWKCHEGTWPDGAFADDHEWEAIINSRTRTPKVSGRGCPCCAGKKVVPSNCLSTTHPKLAKGWHLARNSLTPDDVVAGSQKKVWWKCHEGTWPDGTFVDDHEWEAVIQERTRGRGCSCCHGLTVVPSNCLTATHPELVKQWHPTKNGGLDSNNVIAGSHQRIWWKCAKGHVWDTSPHNRASRGSGCPRCNESKGEKEIIRILEQRGIRYERQYKFPSCRNKRSLAFDFLVHCERKFLIEFQGRQHYEPVNFGGSKSAKKMFAEVLNRDKIKRYWCRENSYPLLEIPYWEYDKIEEMIMEFLKD